MKDKGKISPPIPEASPGETMKEGMGRKSQGFLLHLRLPLPLFFPASCPHCNISLSASPHSSARSAGQHSAKRSRILMQSLPPPLASVHMISTGSSTEGSV